MKSGFLAFSDLDAWKTGHRLVIDLYKVTKEFPQDERFGIVSQTRRAASSITANIAEGFARYHYRDKTRFYYQSRGSAAEVQNFLLLARDLGYLEKYHSEDLINKAEEVIRLINGLIRSIEKQLN